MNARALPEISNRGGLQPPRGAALLTSPQWNKGTAFSEHEKDALGLRGLLPPHVFPIGEQVHRVLGNLRRKQSDLEKYIFLSNLQNRNETLFYRVLLENVAETMPLIYTPTVGQACLEYGAIFRRPRGLWITIEDRGRIREVMSHWPQTGVRLIVVTDGERILGLGDLGALGMGIPVGKLALYSVCAGLHPTYCLPIALDTGTDNEGLLEDPMYIGLRRRRVRGQEYDEFIREFVSAATEAFPGCLVQFEDFANRNAFRLLEEYRDKVCSFNDDIQGTAAVTVAGVLAAMRMIGGELAEQRLLFLGAGEAGIGTANLFVAALVEGGLSEEKACRSCWFLDSKGLVVKDRTAELNEHKRPYAHEHPRLRDLGDAVEAIKPTVLIGVSGQPQTFTPAVLEAMGRLNKRPVIFALSNPTSKAECTAEQAYRHTDGRAVFASGSPFPEVAMGGKRFVPGQANNVYIFPGIGLGVLASGARIVSDAMFLAAAKTLAAQGLASDFEQGRIFPGLDRVRDVSASIAAAVAEVAYESGLATLPRPKDVLADVRSKMYVPEYVDYA